MSVLVTVLASKKPLAPWFPSDFSCLATSLEQSPLVTQLLSLSRVPTHSALGSAELRAVFTLSTLEEAYPRPLRLPAFSSPHLLLVMLYEWGCGASLGLFLLTPVIAE